jgi:hypothetical protein
MNSTMMEKNTDCGGTKAYSIGIFNKQLTKREINYLYALDRGLPLPALLGNPTFFQKLKLLFQLWKIANNVNNII